MIREMRPLMNADDDTIKLLIAAIMRSLASATTLE